MNKYGLPFTDDLDCEALRPFRNSFLRGARIMIGHTRLLRYASFSYIGDKVKDRFGKDIAAKNDFFEAVGKREPLTEDAARALEDMGPQKALEVLCPDR